MQFLVFNYLQRNSLNIHTLVECIASLWRTRQARWFMWYVGSNLPAVKMRRTKRRHPARPSQKHTAFARTPCSKCARALVIYVRAQPVDRMPLTLETDARPCYNENLCTSLSLIIDNDTYRLTSIKTVREQRVQIKKKYSI